MCSYAYSSTKSSRDVYRNIHDIIILILLLDLTEFICLCMNFIAIVVIFESTGMKFIPLRTPGGELIPGSGLFVKVMKVLARSTVKQAENSVADYEKETPSHKLNRETPIFIIESNNETKDDENYKDDADTERIETSHKRGGQEVVDGGLENTSDTQQRLSCPALLGHTALRQ